MKAKTQKVDLEEHQRRVGLRDEHVHPRLPAADVHELAGVAVEAEAEPLALQPCADPVELLGDPLPRVGRAHRGLGAT